MSVGFFGCRDVNPKGIDGIFYGGGGLLLGYQILAVVLVFCYSFFLSLFFALFIERTIGFRISNDEDMPIDELEHNEQAYTFYSYVDPPIRRNRRANVSIKYSSISSPIEASLVTANFSVSPSATSSDFAESITSVTSTQLVLQSDLLLVVAESGV